MRKRAPGASLLTEAEADERFGLEKKLASGGNYGCRVLVFDAADPQIASRDAWMCDVHFRQLWDHHSPDHDVGTILIDGDLRLEHEALISDRLMCLVITGNLTATRFHVFETEVAVFGDLDVDYLQDHDDYLRAHGSSRIGKLASYDD
jgi:hypothetical protein